MVPVGLRFELFVDDVERSVRFYGAVLGLRPAAGYDPQGHVPVSAGQVRIGLQRRDALPAEHHFRPAHLAGPRGVAWRSWSRWTTSTRPSPGPGTRPSPTAGR